MITFSKKNKIIQVFKNKQIIIKIKKATNNLKMFNG